MAKMKHSAPWPKQVSEQIQRLIDMAIASLWRDGCLAVMCVDPAPSDMNQPFFTSSILDGRVGNKLIVATADSILGEKTREQLSAEAEQAFEEAIEKQLEGRAKH